MTTIVQSVLRLKRKYPKKTGYLLTSDKTANRSNQAYLYAILQTPTGHFVKRTLFKKIKKLSCSDWDLFFKNRVLAGYGQKTETQINGIYKSVICAAIARKNNLYIGEVKLVSVIGYALR